MNTILVYLGDAVSGFLGEHSCLFGLIAGTETVADFNLSGDRRVVKRLTVSIEDYKRHIFNALVVHVGHGIAAAASHAYNFYNRLTRFTCHKTSLTHRGYYIFVHRNHVVDK